MGAPGTLIPAEVPSSQLQNAGLDVRGFLDYGETSGGSQLVLDRGAEILAVSPIPNRTPEVGSRKSEESLSVGKQTKYDLNLRDQNQTEG